MYLNPEENILMNPLNNWSSHTKEDMNFQFDTIKSYVGTLREREKLK